MTNAQIRIITRAPEGSVWVPIAVIAVLLIIWELTARFARHLRKRRESQRGFEVKLNTGEEPVLEKKENDHG